MVWSWCGDVNVWIAQLMWIILLEEHYTPPFEWMFINVVESSQFLFVLLWLLNLALSPVSDPRANTSAVLIFPFLSSCITVQQLNQWFQRSVSDLPRWFSFRHARAVGTDLCLVVLCWLPNAFVPFIWSSARGKKKKKKARSALRSDKCPFVHSLLILGGSDVLGCVSYVLRVYLSTVSVIIFSGRCEFCLEPLSNGSLSHLKEMINLSF